MTDAPKRWEPTTSDTRAIAGDEGTQSAVMKGNWTQFPFPGSGEAGAGGWRGPRHPASIIVVKNRAHPVPACVVYAGMSEQDTPDRWPPNGLIPDDQPGSVAARRLNVQGQTVALLAVVHADHSI